MRARQPICKFWVKFLAVLQLLSWNVEAYWANNHTLIKIINSLNYSWKAGENPTNIPGTFPKTLPERPNIPTIHWAKIPTPASFDARKRWKRCRRVTRRIRDQGECGSCWANAAASILSSRTCIETNATYRSHLSVEDVTTCCEFCGPKNGTSCDGGWPEEAINFWIKKGVVTGGEYGSDEGCKPYSWASMRGRPRDCVKLCTNPLYHRPYKKDKLYGKMVYRIPKSVKAIKSEIFYHGPVATVIRIYEDFRQYRTGVYESPYERFKGLHAVTIIGWGKESKKKYWLVANSWGDLWGMDGYVRFLRGKNHCKIEENVVAGRRFKTLTDHETIRGVGFGSSNKGNLCFVEKIYIYASLVWALRGNW